jgi:hypothetical protein
MKRTTVLPLVVSIVVSLVVWAITYAFIDQSWPLYSMAVAVAAGIISFLILLAFGNRAFAQNTIFILTVSAVVPVIALVISLRFLLPTYTCNETPFTITCDPKGTKEECVKIRGGQRLFWNYASNVPNNTPIKLHKFKKMTTGGSNRDDPFVQTTPLYGTSPQPIFADIDDSDPDNYGRFRYSVECTLGQQVVESDPMIDVPPRN